MEVVSVAPFAVGSLRWQARPGAWVLTVVCKATFHLRPGEVALAESQEHVNDDDGYWDDDPRKSLCFAGDLVPYKARADVLLTGSAYAPGGRPTGGLHARLLVGEVDKTIAVHADRFFGLDGHLRDAARFTKMPLRWERAAGGPDTVNPVGIDPTVASATGDLALPNLLPVGLVPQRPREIIEPVCFAPIAPTWLSRREKLGSLAGRFTPADLTDSVLPREIEPSFFQMAPPDQQPSAIAEDAQIILENLHPHHPRLLSRLPGLRPRGFVERQGAPQDLSLRVDTLVIDTDRSLLSVVWRGQVPLATKEETGRVVLAMELRGTRTSWLDVVTLLSKRGARAPFAAGPDDDSTSDIESLSDDDVRPAEQTLIPMVERQDQASETLMLMEAPVQPTMPFAPGEGERDLLRRAAQAAAEGRAAALPVGWGASALNPHPMTPQRAPGETDLPRGGSASPGVEVHPALAPPAMIAARPMFLDTVEPPSAAPPPKPAEVMVAPVLMRATSGVADAAGLGVAGLSNAAAGAHAVVEKDARAGLEEPGLAAEKAPVEPVRPAAPKEAFELLWHAPELVKKLRRDLGWRRLLLESDLEPPTENELEVMSEEDAETPEEADRRRIADALARGAPAGIEVVRESVRKGVRASGRFEAPLLLLEGELEITFDEVETLRAITAAAAPFVAIDKRVKEAVDAAHEALRSSWLAGAAAVAEGYTDRIRDAFTAMRKEAAAGKRPIAADYLDGVAGRALSMARHYQRRPVYGSPHVRGSLRLVGGEEKVPVYLPDDAANRLPLAVKHRVRMFAEVGSRADSAEVSRWAARGAAVSTLIEP